jgi:hypothetical protein
MSKNIRNLNGGVGQVGGGTQAQVEVVQLAQQGLKELLAQQDLRGCKEELAQLAPKGYKE